MVKISVCIPNFNYEQYIGITLDSVLSQQVKNIEVLVADNKSTDNSLNVIKKYANEYQGLKYKQNPTNLGFAGNLDEVARMATGDWMIMMSSDDVMMEKTLELCNKFIENVGNNDRYIFAFAANTIDSSGKVIDQNIGPRTMTLWHKSDIDPVSSSLMGCDVYKILAKELLGRCLQRLRTPSLFTATFYPRSIYNKVGGYGGGRLINPDKWFHWKVLAEVDYAYYIDTEGFYYRVHNNNQNSQQSKAGYLKFLVDEYRNTMEIDSYILTDTGVTKVQVAENFINQDVLNNSFNNLRNGNWQYAAREFLFGAAVYPGLTFKNKKAYLQIGLLLLGPLGILLAKLIPKKSAYS